MGENLRQAPRLYHNKDEYVVGNFYLLPQQIMDKVFSQLDGRSGGQIKIMVVLLGTAGDGSFKVSEEWVRKKTGMAKNAYRRSRAELVKKGWVVLTDDGCIVVDVDKICE